MIAVPQFLDRPFPGTPPTKRSPLAVPATPPPRAAACCSCPYGCGGIPSLFYEQKAVLFL